MVEPAQERPDPRAPGAAVVDRRDGEQHQRGGREDRRPDPRGRVVGDSATRTIPAARVSGAVTACSQPRSLGLTSDEGVAHVVADARRPRRPAAATTVRCRSMDHATVATAPQPAAAGPSKVGPPWRTGSNAVTAGALPGLRSASGAPSAGRPAAQARRRDARRQPPLGPRRRRATPPHGHRAGAANISPLLEWCEEARGRGGHAVAALDRQPQPARRRAAAAAGDHRGGGRRPRRPAPLAAATRSVPSTCSRPTPRAGSRRPPTRPARSTG